MNDSEQQARLGAGLEEREEPDSLPRRNARGRREIKRAATVFSDSECTLRSHKNRGISKWPTTVSRAQRIPGLSPPLT